MRESTIEIEKGSKLSWVLPDRISEILDELPEYARDDLLKNAEELLRVVSLLITGLLHAPACAMLIFPRAFGEIGKLCKEAIEMMGKPEEEIKGLLEEEIKRIEELKRKN